MASEESLANGEAYTMCELGMINSGWGQSLTLDLTSSLDGYGVPPQVIPSNQTLGFKHMADSMASLGSLTYVLNYNPQAPESNPKWVIAWKNVRGWAGKPNQVYTEVSSDSEPFDLDKIKQCLESSECENVNSSMKLKAEATIDPSGDTPTMKATLSCI